jgi:UDP-galactopyranose mutase
VGQDIYERLILGYTQKQWQKHPRDLPAEIIRRLPVRFTYDCNYFNDRYQGIPVDGYTQVFEKMLEGVDVQLGVDFHESRRFWESQATQIVYTGKIDELFGFNGGELEYRTLKFEDTWHQQRNVQGNAVINYCDADVPWTRMIEHKHFSPRADDPEFSIVTRETPMTWSREETPYYPINNDANMAIYKNYADRAASLDRYILGGRLAEYKYYDMHAVIGSALLRCQSLGLSVDHRS